ncbi:MAG: glycosyltransferase family 2 protein [Deltaproteobacteria bacterium]|nr:glycosyltransferase family 2 protein [Deltaproteobacteria bacterium]
MLYGRQIAVVVPAFNEEKFIVRTLRSVPRFIDQIVVVDDASTDATADRAARVRDERVSILRMASNRGVGAAIATGYARALNRGADWIVVMAADNQMDPGDLRALLRPLASGDADYVKGNRLGHASVRASMPFVRRVGNAILTRLTRLACGTPHLTDSQCGYTVITRQAALALPLDRLYPRYGYPIDLISRLTLQGARITDVVVRPIYGDEESGIRLTRDVPRILWILARAAFRRAAATTVARRLPAAAPIRS